LYNEDFILFFFEKITHNMISNKFKTHFTYMRAQKERK